jgi:hypothetical protein
MTPIFFEHSDLPGSPSCLSITLRSSRARQIQGDCVENKRKQKDAVCNNVRRFRDQQRTVIDGQSHSANNLLFTPTLPYIPIHQQLAIHNFSASSEGLILLWTRAQHVKNATMVCI